MLLNAIRPGSYHSFICVLKGMNVLFLIVGLSFHSSAYADLIKGDVALAAGDLTEAIAFYQSSEHDIEAKIKLASIWMNRDLDSAEDWIEKARKQNSEHAQMHFLRGQIMGMQASNSIFSALSYASKSLESFEKAVALAPDNVNYQNGLLSFYTQAPGIAGGDMDKAKSVALAIAALDPIEGLKANIMVYSQLDDQEGLNALLQKGLTEHSDDSWFMFTAGMIKQSQQEYAQAVGMLSQVSKNQEAKNEESTDQTNIQRYYSAQYQIGKTAILANDFYEQGLNALNNYIDNALISDGMPSIGWASLRKANIIEAMGDKTAAYQLYMSIEHHDDKQLKKELKKVLKRFR